MSGKRKEGDGIPLYLFLQQINHCCAVNGLYKVIHEVLIGAKMCDLELPLGEI